jgi:hypothetical protein
MRQKPKPGQKTLDHIWTICVVRGESEDISLKRKCPSQMLLPAAQSYSERLAYGIPLTSNKMGLSSTLAFDKYVDVVAGWLLCL